jgi:GTPase
MQTPSSACDTCPVHTEMARLGAVTTGVDAVVALAGNPNTGKSTLFNAVTGLRQHTGNWPGKTVTRAEGAFQFGTRRYKLVDLPGTYSLLSASQDEEVARNFLLFGRPDCTVVVMDASAIERNLYLALQVLEITDRVVVAVNLIDEASRRGIEVDVRSLARDLGVPRTTPLRTAGTADFERAVQELLPMIEAVAPGLPNARWVAIRLLDGDAAVEAALTSGELAAIVARQQQPDRRFSDRLALQGAQ